MEHLQAESLAPLPGPASAAGEDSSSQWLAALAADGSLLPAVRELMQQLAQALIAQRQLQDQLSLMEETEAHNAEITQRLTTANASSDGHTGQPAAAEGLTQAMAGPRSLPLCKTADSAGPERPAVPGSGPNFGKLAQLVSGAKALLGSKALPAAGQHTHPEKEAIPLSTTITISELSPTAERGSECSNAVPVSVTHTPQTAAILGVQQDGSKGGQPGHQMLLERIDELQKEVGSLAQPQQGSLLQQPGKICIPVSLSALQSAAFGRIVKWLALIDAGEAFVCGSGLQDPGGLTAEQQERQPG